jgi:hypothetical protein
LSCCVVGHPDEPALIHRHDGSWTGLDLRAKSLLPSDDHPGIANQFRDEKAAARKSQRLKSKMGKRFVEGTEEFGENGA